MSSQPLSGIRVLVGRAFHQASALSDRLRNLGATVIEIPFIEICEPQSYGPLDDALSNFRTYDWVILTSVNGVESIFRRFDMLHLDPSALSQLQIAAIGPATKKAVEKRGLRVSVVPKEYVAESVVQSLRDRIGGKRVLLARAKIARDVIPSELRRLGATVDVIEAYETRLPSDSGDKLRAALLDRQQPPDVITFTSSSSVRNFLALAGPDAKFDGIRFASIGPVTSATLRELKLPVDIEAREFTMAGLVEAIVELSKT